MLSWICQVCFALAESAAFGSMFLATASADKALMVASGRSVLGGKGVSGSLSNEVVNSSSCRGSKVVWLGEASRPHQWGDLGVLDLR